MAEEVNDQAQAQAKRIVSMVLACPLGEVVTTRQVWNHLSRLGYKISKRTVERDLSVSCRLFGIKRMEGAGRCAEWKRVKRLEP
jgi:hypothetical protein